MSAVATPMPWYARPAACTVLVAALVMSAPGEFALAVLAGWSAWVAWLMPVCVSVYAAVAALFVDASPKGARGRGTAILGAAGALALALAAQVTAHWIAAGYLESSMALVGAVSAVPPVVVAHVMHMVTRATPEAREAVAAVVQHVAGVAAQEEPVADAEELVNAEASHGVLPPAKLSVVKDAPEADTLPGLEEPDVTPAKSRKSGRSLEDIRAAVAALEADGQEVNGTTYGRLVGVSGRTARRDLAILAA
ncbi:hypothetical protein J7E91_23015 [Streptomyces sp. ISL-99]|uniref:hypothetical protein n=1 Tax=Streptomyces sp. ISL-99 TaxID=2819193 RepID=UPI001BEC640F|nr:hypothetical protein [Streptomyces sp. ISL-99]MBT2528206.1 hypothetical protein [Streptomyces sp. ISL-99]